MAGYKPDEGNPYKLTGNYRVQERVKELIEEAFSKQDLETALTPEWIKSKLIEQASKADRPADRIRALELLAKYLPGMREADKTLSLEEEVRGLIESLGYGMAKAVLEERNMAHVMDTLEGEYSEAEPAKITEDVE